MIIARTAAPPSPPIKDGGGGREGKRGGITQVLRARAHPRSPHSPLAPAVLVQVAAIETARYSTPKSGSGQMKGYSMYSK